MTDFDRNVLFEMDSLRVIFTRSRKRKHAPIVFTFHGYNASPRFQDTGFAEGFLSDRGFDAIHFLTAKNDWYQSQYMQDAINIATHKATTESSQFVSYGSSMGAYAACLYANWLGATRAIAFSPQFSIRRDVVPSERRWLKESQEIDFKYDHMLQMAGQAHELFIIHDPTDPDDRFQIDLFRQLQNIIEFKVPLVGHEVLRFIHEIRLLPEFLEATILGDFDTSYFRNEIRKRRGSSSLYLSSASKRLALSRHKKTAQGLLDKYSTIATKRPESVPVAEFAMRLLAVPAKRQQ